MVTGRGMEATVAATTTGRLYQAVARRLADDIREGVYRPGARLPGERELAERFGVSRVTIREAGIALETQGLITIRNGSGIYVRQDLPADPASFPDMSAFELTTARLVVESEAAAIAAINLSDDELAELEAIVQGMAATEEAGAPDAEALDQRFHMTIARATGNAAIEHLIAQLWRMRSELPRVREVYASVCGRNAETRTHEHRAIFEALKRRDPAAARSAMREHFHRLFDTMLAAREDAAIAELRRSIGEDRERFLQTSALQPV